jgi:hypothetical protein
MPLETVVLQIFREHHERVSEQIAQTNARQWCEHARHLEAERSEHKAQR